MTELIASQGINFTSISRGIIGMIVLIVIAYIFSSDRKSISWKVVGIGLFMQLLIAVGVLYVPFVAAFFDTVGQMFVKVMDFTKAGTSFLFNSFTSGQIESPLINFAIMILPTIIFFSALTSVLFFLGIIQKIVKALAVVLTKTLNISGAESLSVAGNIFLGQTEAPLMIKAYLERMNRSEILLVMIGGMATVAGGVLAAYVSFLGGDDPVQQAFYAKHLLSASVMAAPGAIVVAKILMPQTEKIDSNIEVSKEKAGSNFLDAMASGTTDGLKLAVNIGAMLLVFFAFIAMGNYILQVLGHFTSFLHWIVAAVFAAGVSYYKRENIPVFRNFFMNFFGVLVAVVLYRYIMVLNVDGYTFGNSISQWIATHTNYDKLSMEFILGYTFAPLMWLIGVAKEDITILGQLLGIKLIASEFVGYINLAEFKNVASAMHLSYEKSVLIATYMLCGFANFASIGIQVGGIGHLAPNQRKRLSEFGIKALIGGTLASLLSANFAGMLVG
ncbi:MAG: nucleoside transporter C-terminal domain-containing protein [Gammaproteobacteria bacterium]|jgi:CNT family concentrative nucleoside transporter|nr:NupC/NupG family nucleoside CNT transporter [Xanthomonadales bacterium]